MYEFGHFWTYYILYILCFHACIYSLTFTLENQKKKIPKRINLNLFDNEEYILYTYIIKIDLILFRP